MNNMHAMNMWLTAAATVVVGGLDFAPMASQQCCGPGAAQLK